MTGTALPWWLALATETVNASSSRCRTCRTSNDSVDVFCSLDGVSLLGKLLSERSLYFTAYVLRGIVIAAAVAVGYLRLEWAAYIASAILVGAFASLFVRNHRLTMNYLVGTFSVIVAGYAIWQTEGGRFGAEILVAALLTAVCSEFLFLGSATLLLLPEPDSGDALGMTPWTALTAAVGMTVTAACLGVLLIERFDSSWIPDWLVWIVRHAVTLAASIFTAALLIASIAHTLNGPAFQVTDPIRYAPPLKPVNLRRLTLPRRAPPRSYIDTMAATLERASIFFANGLIGAVEQTYNQQVRFIINGFWRVCVAIANAVYRTVVKLLLHVERTSRRWGLLAARSFGWSCVIAWRYTFRFILPITAGVVAAWQLWNTAGLLDAYIAREAAWYTPLGVLLRWAVVTSVLAVSTMLSVHVGVASALRKFAAAAIPLGSNGFFFFVLIAWTLGVIGTFTDGPYRIGWVTITSTIIIAGVLIQAYGRGGAARAPGS